MLSFSDSSHRAGSGVVRIDPLRFLKPDVKGGLNQAIYVLSVSIGFFVCTLLFTRVTFVLTLVCISMCSVSWLLLVVSTCHLIGQKDSFEVAFTR